MKAPDKAAPPRSAIEASEWCEPYSKLAATTMKARHAGVPMAALMKAAKQNAATTAEANFVAEIVLLAYQRPVYESQTLIDQSIAEFSDEVQLQCIQALKEKT
jgi:hypothetical protein